MQADPSTTPDAPALPLHYFKRVRLLPRIRWALGVLHTVQPASLLDIGSGRGKFPERVNNNGTRKSDNY
jgi:hypothetical protein